MPTLARLRLATIAGVMAIAGCGGAYDATVSGVVKFDGSPLQRGTIKFIPDASGAPGYGLIGSDGTYMIRTGREEGIKSGAYTVTVVANEVSTPNSNPSLPPTPGKPVSPAWYRDAATSPLKQTVEAGANVINLELNSTPPPGWKPRSGARR